MIVQSIQSIPFILSNVWSKMAAEDSVTTKMRWDVAFWLLLAAHVPLLVKSVLDARDWFGSAMLLGCGLAAGGLIARRWPNSRGWNDRAVPGVLLMLNSGVFLTSLALFSPVLAYASAILTLAGLLIAQCGRGFWLVLLPAWSLLWLPLLVISSFGHRGVAALQWTATGLVSRGLDAFGVAHVASFDAILLVKDTVGFAVALESRVLLGLLVAVAVGRVWRGRGTLRAGLFVVSTAVWSFLAMVAYRAVLVIAAERAASEAFDWGRELLLAEALVGVVLLLVGSSARLVSILVWTARASWRSTTRDLKSLTNWTERRKGGTAKRKTKRRSAVPQPSVSRSGLWLARGRKIAVSSFVLGCVISFGWQVYAMVEVPRGENAERSEVVLEFGMVAVEIESGARQVPAELAGWRQVVSRDVRATTEQNGFDEWWVESEWIREDGRWAFVVQASVDDEGETLPPSIAGLKGDGVWQLTAVAYSEARLLPSQREEVCNQVLIPILKP